VLWVAERYRALKVSAVHPSRRLMMPIPGPAGTGVTVFVMDTALDYSHCAFYDAARPAPPRALWYQSLPADAGHRKIRAVWWQDESIRGAYEGAHGTSTAGVAVGGDCHLGPSVFAGVADGARLLFLQMAAGYSDSSPLYLPADVNAMFDRAVAAGASVSSSSFGYPVGDGLYDDLAAQYDESAQEHPHLVHVTAAGNEGLNAPYDLVSSPGTLKNGLSVGAVFSLAADYAGLFHTQGAEALYTLESVAGFSSRGPTLDGRVAPQLYAPGVFVPAPYAFAAPYANHWDEEYATGTSFACPGVAGQAAGVQALWRSRFGALPRSETVRALLFSAARRPARVVSHSQPAVRVLSRGAERFGYGTATLGEDPLAGRWVREATLGADRRWSVTLRGDFRANDSVALAWVDRPGVPGARRALVVDLDLYALTDDANVAGTPDAVNPQEVVQGLGRASASLKLVVVGPEAGYRFSVVATHGGAQVEEEPAQPCLPWEQGPSACAEGFVALCEVGCVRRSCPAGTAGADCAVNVTRPVSPCTVPPGGRGFVLEENGPCVVHTCPADFQIGPDGTSCRCETGAQASASRCPGGPSLACDASFSYPCRAVAVRDAPSSAFRGRNWAVPLVVAILALA